MATGGGPFGGGVPPEGEEEYGAEGGGEPLTEEQEAAMKAAAMEQLSQMPVSEIKKILAEAGADYSACVEKAELVALLMEHFDVSRA